MRLSLAYALAAALLSSACGASDAPPSATAPAPVAASPVEAAPAPAEPTAAAEPSAAAELSVTVANIEKGGAAANTPVALTATAGVNQIEVHFEHLMHYCDPAPSFTASAESEVLRLELLRPEVVSRCAMPHRLDAVVAVPGRNNLRRVVLVDHEGKELGSATISAAARCYVKGAKGECWDSSEAACEALGCAAGQCICTEATSNNSCSCR